MDVRALGSRVRWLLRREGARLRWRGLIGIALLAVAAGLALAVLVPAVDETESLKADVAALRTRMKSVGESGGASARTVAPTRSVQLANFYAFFPASVTLPDWVGQIHNAAQRSGLALDSGEYQLQQSPNERLLRYQVRLPVKGTYPQLRAFVSEVLAKVPSAALDDVVVKRDGIGTPELEARFTFTLFFGDGT